MTARDPNEPPDTQCSACLLRGRRVAMAVGHRCEAVVRCSKCDGPLMQTVLMWRAGDGWLSALDLCPACVAEAKRAFNVE